MENFSICIATSNAHKISEFQQMFRAEGLHCNVFGVNQLAGFVAPEENGTTFAENAFIKAQAAKDIAPSEAWVMADDSGIVVDALNGAPGIMSARYAGVSGANADEANNAKLLQELVNVPDEKRTARFVCALALIAPNGEKYLFEGKIEGTINHGAKGVRGFGYDPLFLLPERNLTTAELSAEEKNAISHRGSAFKKLASFIKSTR